MIHMADWNTECNYKKIWKLWASQLSLEKTDEKKYIQE